MVEILLSPAFSKKSGGTLFSAFRSAWCVVGSAWCVVRGSGFLVGTLSPQFLPQFVANPFETLQGLLRWSEDLHVVFSES